MQAKACLWAETELRLLLRPLLPPSPPSLFPSLSLSRSLSLFRLVADVFDAEAGDRPFRLAFVGCLG